MAAILGNTCVVTLEELVPKFFPSYDALRVKLKRDEEKDFGIRRFMRGGNNRRLLVDYDTLPKKIKKKILDPRKPEHILENYYAVTREITSYYNDYQYPDGGYLLPEAIDKYIVNASVLTALVKLEEARKNERVKLGGSLRGIIDGLYEDAHSFNAVLLPKYECKHTLNTNLRSFKRQFKSFKDSGLYSVIIDPEGKRRKNALVRDEKTEQLLDNMFAGQKHKPTATEVADQYQAFLAGYIEIANKATGEEYNPKDYKPLSNRSITSYLATWESKIGTYAKRSGDRQKLSQIFEPYHSMERPLLAGSIISIDDRQPPFEYEKGKRMWWYLAIDVASEAIVAWAYGKTKEELIINFYKNLVSNFNNWGLELPAELECESSLNSSFKDTFLQEGSMFEYVRIYANKARSKIVERFFGELRYRMEKKHVGWIARPFAMSESNQAGADSKTIVPYNKLVEQCMKDIVTWNNMPHGKDKSIARFDYFLQRQNPDLKKTNYKSFAKYLGELSKSSCNAGIVRFNNGEWILGDKGRVYTGEKLISLLKQVEGKDIKISWLDDVKGNVYKALVYDVKDGRYICELHSKPKSARSRKEETEEHRKARDLMNKYVQTVNSYMRIKKNAIDDVYIDDNRPVTISNSFTMPGLKTVTERKLPVADLGEAFADDDFNYTPTEHHAQGLDRAFKN